MISSLRLLNFKCFGDLSLPMTPLTLLCGLNGMGKSSVIQALLVLRQSYQLGELLNGRLVLGGDLADLGTGADILFEDAAEDMIAFELESSEPGMPRWSLTFDYTRDADELAVRPVRSPQPTSHALLPSHVPVPWRERPPCGGSVVYVNAERIGPRKLHQLSETRAHVGDFGARGEYALNYLTLNQTMRLTDDDPRSIATTSHRLADEVYGWLQEVTPGVHLELERIQRADAVIAGFRFERRGDVASRPYRPTNVGFGLSYVLPVVVALLTAPSGSLVIVENPEAHLHPRGQTKLAELASRAALAGVQVLVETHSDHFMDGVRIAVRDRILTPDTLSFHYFAQEDSRFVVKSPTVYPDGRLSEWPSGFFDQRDENLVRLLAPRD